MSKIKVFSSLHNLKALSIEIVDEIPDHEILEPSDPQRAIDTALLVAIVGVLGTSLGAIITGVFNVLKTTESQKIIIVGKSGRKIEVPASTSKADLDEIIELSKSIDVDRIEF
ncbi:MAG: hypothetical protein AAF620_04845 [Bacteroidota bacterium]